jgi:hypothetical protein
MALPIFKRSTAAIWSFNTLKQDGQIVCVVSEPAGPGRTTTSHHPQTTCQESRAMLFLELQLEDR